MKERIYDDIKWIVSSLAGNVVKFFKWVLGLMVFIVIALIIIIFVLITGLF